jgi:CRP-like cAMP-binding protein
MAEPGIQGSALSAVPLFADLPPEDLEAVLDLGSPVSFAPGQPIVEKGQRADGMYVILSGRAEVDVGGRYHSLGPGDFLGEMALLSSKTRMATVKAVEPVEALQIDAQGFQSFLLGRPTVAVAMLKALVERLREVQERIDAWIGT